MSDRTNAAALAWCRKHRATICYGDYYLDLHPGARHVVRVTMYRRASAPAVTAKTLVSAVAMLRRLMFAKPRKAAKSR